MVRVNRLGLHKTALEAEFRSWMSVRMSIIHAGERYPFASPERQRFRAVVEAMDAAITGEGYSILDIMGAYQGPERIAKAAIPPRG